MLPEGFETSVPASERFQTQAFDRAATRIRLMFLQDIILSDNYHVLLPLLLLHALRPSTLPYINGLKEPTGDDSRQLSHKKMVLRTANFNNILIRLVIKSVIFLNF